MDTKRLEPNVSFLRGKRAVVLAVVVIFCAVVGSLILFQPPGGPQVWDQNEYHLPAIKQFSAQLPTPDISDYNLAMTPGYHLALAVIDRYVSDDLRVLQGFNSLFGLCLIVLVLWNVWRFVGPWAGMLLVGPLLLSGYVLRVGAFLNTDNAALVLVAFVVAGVAFQPTTPARSLRLGLISMAAVAVRQIQVWPVGLVLLGGMMASPLAKRVPWLPGIAVPTTQRWANLLAASVAFLMPWVVIGFFVSVWGGLTPPMMAEKHNASLALVTPAYSLSLIACFGVFFLPVCFSMPTRGSVRGWWIWPGVVVGFLGAVAVPTTFEAAAGINGGGILWIVARNMPEVADRSLLLMVLAPLGAVVILAMIRETILRGHGRVGVMLGVGVLGFIAAQTFNPQVSQRYFEPIMLVMLAWLAAAGARDDRTWGWVVGPGLLCFAQLVMLLPRLGLIPGGM
jgi:hypothetical protein